MRRRLRYSWRLLAVTSLGVLGAVVLLSSTAGYNRVLAEAGIRHALLSKSSSSNNVQVVSENRPLGIADYNRLRSLAEEAVARRLQGLATGMERFGRAQAGMPLTEDPALAPPPLGAPSGRPFFLTGFSENSRLLEGRWPDRPGTAGLDGVNLQAVAGQRVASDMGFEVGDRIYVTPFRASPEERIVLEIVGIAVPLDSQDDFWFGSSSYFSLQSVGEILVAPVYVTEDDFLRVLGNRFPTAVGDFGFNIFTAPSVITANEIDATKEALAGLEADLNKTYPRTFVFSRLKTTIRDFERELALARVPVYVFASLVVMVVLYFLALITGILGRSQGEELGLLRSRGGSALQVCGVLLLADGVLALAAAAVGPLLAWLIVKFLLLPTFGDVGGGPIEFGLTVQMYWMGALGALLALLALAVSAASRARGAAGDPMLSRSRPPEVSFFHRYYLDLIAVAVVGLLWWQFQERDGFLSRSLEYRGLEIDPALILGPVLGLLTAALLLMRILPWAVKLTVWACTLGGPAWSSFSLARLARDPVIPASMAVLLLLATALGVFGATFQASLSENRNDQASYRVGGEVVISGPRARTDLADELQQLPGVRGATPVLRETVSMVGQNGVIPTTLLAASPEVLSQSAWFREDFSSSELAELTALIQSSPVENPLGIELPADAESLGVWLNAASLSGHDLIADINVWAKLTDAEGRYRNMSLGGFGGPDTGVPQGWALFSGDLPSQTSRQQTQWYLSSVYFTTSSFTTVPASTIYLDDVTVYGSTLPDSGILVEGFEEPGPWVSIGVAFGAPDASRIEPVARTGAGGLSFSWTEPFRGDQRGIFIPPVRLPIPAIADDSFYVGQNLYVRHGSSSIPIRIVGVSQLFPSITNLDRPYIIVGYDDYVAYSRILPRHGLGLRPREIWVSLEPAADRLEAVRNITGALPQFTGIADRVAEAEIASGNPLAGGGWNGLTLMAMTAIGLAVAATLLLQSAANARMNRIDVSVARALGLSNRQVFLSMVAEKLALCGTAILIGAAIGYWPGRELVEMLAVTSAGAPPVPPLIPKVNLPLLVLVLAGLSAAVLASAWYATLLALRERPAEALRQRA